MWIPVEKAEETYERTITYREDHGCVVRVPSVVTITETSASTPRKKNELSNLNAIK
jgi:hypothetical protein